MAKIEVIILLSCGGATAFAGPFDALHSAGVKTQLNLEIKPVMQIHEGLRPGDLGYVIYLHGTLYAKEYNLDHTFEGHVAARIGDFAIQFDPEKDFFAVVEDEGDIVGSIAIHGLGEGNALLRWFLLHPKTRGKGLGRQLLNRALDFCRERNFQTVDLWTISELKTAAHLYRQVGFQLVEENTRELWGGVRTEQQYQLSL